MVKTRTSVRHIAIEKSLDRDQPTFSHFVTSYLLYNFYLNFFKNSLNTWKVKTLANNVQNREITWHRFNEIRMPYKIQHYEQY